MRQAPFGYRLMKRAMDIVASAVLLVLLSPVMLLLAVLVRWKMGSPVIFRQERAGLRAKPFTMLKFRSMRFAHDASGKPLPDGERMTPLGRVLRKSSLDELPQLWCVLKGEMSLVGPRPLYMEYVPRYSPEQRRRLDVRPGITGLAQIAGRNTLGWADRLRLDVEYVDRPSLREDVRILLLTVKKVLIRDGVPSTGVDPNRRFQGDVVTTEGATFPAKAPVELSK